MFEIEIRCFDENGNLTDTLPVFAHEFKVNFFCNNDGDEAEMLHVDGVRDNTARVFRVRAISPDPWTEEIVELIDID